MSARRRISLTTEMHVDDPRTSQKASGGNQPAKTFSNNNFLSFVPILCMVASIFLSSRQLRGVPGRVNTRAVAVDNDGDVLHRHIHSLNATLAVLQSRLHAAEHATAAVARDSVALTETLRFQNESVRQLMRQQQALEVSWDGHVDRNQAVAADLAARLDTLRLKLVQLESLKVKEREREAAVIVDDRAWQQLAGRVAQLETTATTLESKVASAATVSVPAPTTAITPATATAPAAVTAALEETVVDDDVDLTRGATVVHHSPTYLPPRAAWVAPWARVLGMDLGVGVPEDALSDDLSLGSCWPMEGSQGLLVLRLPRPAVVRNVQIDHCPDAVDARSAPRHFSVHVAGTAEENLRAVAKGVVGATGAHVPIDGHQSPVEYVALQIHDNHGNGQFTCLYRLRVFGV